MEAFEYWHQINKIELVKQSRKIKIGKGFYSEYDGSSFPLIYSPNHHTAIGKSYIYQCWRFGDATSENRKPFYIALDESENIEFLFIQKSLWIQKKENVMWLVNVLVAIMAVIATIKAAK